jgi:hypothetical protein
MRHTVAVSTEIVVLDLATELLVLLPFVMELHPDFVAAMHQLFAGDSVLGAFQPGKERLAWLLFR